MKKVIIYSILVSSLILAACQHRRINEDNKEQESQRIERVNNEQSSIHEILVVDGCQYVLFKENARTTREYKYMAHKGNCNNPIHYYQTLDFMSEAL